MAFMRNEFWWEAIVTGLLLLLEVYCVYLWFSRRECFRASREISQDLLECDKEFEKYYLMKSYSKDNIEILKIKFSVMMYDKSSPKYSSNFVVKKDSIEDSWVAKIYESLMDISDILPWKKM
uniref:ATP synthase F0 subunit 8 n=1 Tax=Mytilus trossulus TaxID=6551 RepID=A0A6C0T6X1_MYTTR|nr:ATP synthase F0 subunit 8 [Mytilus trossulus]